MFNVEEAVTIQEESSKPKRKGKRKVKHKLQRQSAEEPGHDTVSKTIDEVLLKENIFFFEYDVGGEAKTKIERRSPSLNPSAIFDLESVLLENPIISNSISFVDFKQTQSINLLTTHSVQCVDEIEEFNKLPRKYRNAAKKLKSRLLSSEPEPITFEGKLFTNFPLFKPRMFKKPNKEIALHQNFNNPVDFSGNINSKLLEISKVSLLEIQFGSVKFLHHPLFTLEQVLAGLLLQMYDRYSEIKNSIKTVENEIEIKRKLKAKIKREILGNNDDIKSFYRDPRVINYIEALVVLKDKHLHLLKFHKEIKTKVQALWYDIRLVRKYRSINTPIILVLTKVRDDNYETKYNDKFQVELEDKMDEIEYNFLKEKTKYKQLMRTCNARGDEIFPEKPFLKIDAEMLHAEIKEILDIIYPEEPQINFILSTNETILNENSSRSIKDIKFHFKILIDDVEVCDTNDFSLNGDMAIISETCSIQILSHNVVFTFKLYQDYTCIFEKYINIADVKNNLMTAPVTKLIFELNDSVDPTNELVGSGQSLKELSDFYLINLKSSRYFHNILATKCEINFRIGRTGSSRIINPELYKLLILRTSLNDAVRSINLNYNTVEEVIKAVYTDVNIVRRYLMELQQLKTKKTGVVKLGSDIDFDTTDISKERIKYDLLRMRNERLVYGLKDTKIPLSSKCITPELIALYERGTNIINIDEVSNYSELEIINVKRFTSLKYLEKAKNYIAQRKTRNDLKRVASDIMWDYEFSNLNMILTSQWHATFQQSYHLRNRPNNNHKLRLRVTILKAFSLPERNIKNKNNELALANKNDIPLNSLKPFIRVSCQGHSLQTFVSAGSNPTWNETIYFDIKTEPSPQLHFNLYDQVKEEVESLEKNDNITVSRTTNRWLASLHIPMSILSNSSDVAASFKMIHPPLILGYKYNNNDDNRGVGAETQRNSIYLALHISINQTFTETNASSTDFALDTSENETVERHLKDFVINYTRDFADRIIHVFFMATNGKNTCVIRFLQPVSIPDLENFVHDLKQLRRESIFSKSSSSSQGHRDKNDNERAEKGRNLSASNDAWPTDRSGESMEMKNLKANISTLENTMHKCARYVSLIPIEDEQRSTVTLSAVETLKLSYGTSLDHAILLASYFLYLGIRCWILYGQAIPRGTDYFVLVKYNNKTNRILLATDEVKRIRLYSSFKREIYSFYIYDATTADVYNLRENSPLKTIYYCFNEENVWANIQVNDISELTRLDFEQTSDWRPVFDKNISISKTFPMTDDVMYAEPLEVEVLKKLIETKIKSKIEKWRSNRKTIWNRYCSGLLSNTLTQWEAWTLNKNSAKPDLSPKMEQLLISHEVYGFPLNLPYINMKSILSTVKSTTIGLNEDSLTEFALAVQVFSYPNAVLSVWVYLVTMRRK